MIYHPVTISIFSAALIFYYEEIVVSNLFVITILIIDVFLYMDHTDVLQFKNPSRDDKAFTEKQCSFQIKNFNKIVITVMRRSEPKPKIIYCKLENLIRDSLHNIPRSQSQSKNTIRYVKTEQGCQQRDSSSSKVKRDTLKETSKTLNCHIESKEDSCISMLNELENFVRNAKASVEESNTFKPSTKSHQLRKIVDVVKNNISSLIMSENVLSQGMTEGASNSWQKKYKANKQNPIVYRQDSYKKLGQMSYNNRKKLTNFRAQNERSRSIYQQILDKVGR